MGLLVFLLIGLIAGSIAKMISPQKERSGWVSSLVLGILGAYTGRFIAGLLGIASSNFILSAVIATIGAVILLFIYHKFFGHKNWL